MTEQTRHDRFNKAEEAYQAAEDQVKRAHAVWVDACHRRDRTDNERRNAFCELVAGAVGEEGDGK